MKRVSELSRDELLALEDSQIDILVDLECAYEGLAFCDRPVPLDIPKIEPDTTLYLTNGIYFKSLEVAQKLCSFLMENADDLRHVSGGYGYSTAHHEEKQLDQWGQESLSKISQTKVYSAKLLAEHQSSLDKCKKMEIEHKHKQEAWDKYFEKRRQLEKRVWDKYNEAREWKNDFDTLARALDRYMVLAGNDQNIAEKFFREAYPSWDQTMLDQVLDRCFNSQF